jgi:hypothetical protein
MLSRPGVRPGTHPRLGGIIDSAGLVDGGCAGAARGSAGGASQDRDLVFCRMDGTPLDWWQQIRPALTKGAAAMDRSSRGSTRPLGGPPGAGSLRSKGAPIASR